MNFYQCVEKWHLEWLMKDIQDLLESTRKSNLQKEEDTKTKNKEIPSIPKFKLTFNKCNQEFFVTN